TANTMQQVGAAVGTALLSTFAASATKDFLTGHAAGPPQPALIEAAQVHGYTTGFWIAAGIFAGGALITALLLPSGTPAQHAESRLASAVAG
ncbi:MAG TPA: hypothetical protein VNT22_07780, partial [Baekduia sp.]|nr:hypothetical protein [Baekduia sp.]